MPVDPGIVEEQLSAIGEADRWWNDREVRELPAILNPGERIHVIVPGRVLNWLRPSHRWLVAVTSERIICLKVGERFGRNQLELPLARVTSVAHRSGVISSRIIIVSGEEKRRIRTSKADALRLLGALSALIQRIDASVPARTGSVGTRLATLADQSALEARLDLLEEELERVRQQVDFLEDLMRQRESALLQRSGS